MPCRAAEAPLKLFDVEDYTGLLSAVEAFVSFIHFRYFPEHLLL